MHPPTNAEHIFNQREQRLLQIGIDLETTGTDPSRARVVQFASIARCPGWLLAPIEERFLVDPGCPIPPSATAVHKLTDDMVRGQPTLADYAPRLVETLSRAGSPGACIVGYNARRYDLPLLTHALAATAGVIGPAPMIIDVYDLVMWHCRGFRSRKLWDVAEVLGVAQEPTVLFDASGSQSSEPERPHDALSDIRVMFRVLDALRQRMGIPDTMQGDLNLLRIAMVAAVRIDAEYNQFAHFVYRDRDTWDSDSAVFRLGFGKFSGRELRELRETEPGYCRFLERDVIPRMPIGAVKAFGDAGYRVPEKADAQRSE